jgi:hypothetical protein
MNPLKPGSELGCSWRDNSSCSTGDTRGVTLATNPVMSHEWGKDQIVNMHTEHIRGHLLHYTDIP